MNSDESRKSQRFKRVDLSYYRDLLDVVEADKTRKTVRFEKIALQLLNLFHLLLALAAGVIIYTLTAEIGKSIFASVIIFVLGLDTRLRFSDYIKQKTSELRYNERSLRDLSDCATGIDVLLRQSVSWNQIFDRASHAYNQG